MKMNLWGYLRVCPLLFRFYDLGINQEALWQRYLERMEEAGTSREEKKVG